MEKSEQMKTDPASLAAMIDHTLLKPEATEAQVETVCKEALRYKFASVCINPSYVKKAAGFLQNSEVKVCTVVGFPLGAHTPETKQFETRQAIENGAAEIDMVMNIGALKSGRKELLYQDMRAVVEVCREADVVSKVILETALLSDEEKVEACKIAARADVDFVKTSTGFGPGGATSHDVSLMKQTVAEFGIGVKASGGIRSFADAVQMIKAGATRIGASASVKIVEEAVRSR